MAVSGVTVDTFRDLVLGLQDVVEGAHMGHADFRAGGRIFAGLTANEEQATLRLPPAEQAALLESAPTVFTPAAGAWGRQGWTLMDLRKVDTATARAAVVIAWEHTIANPVRARGSRSARPRRP
jgi:hypothetical protein